MVIFSTCLHIGLFIFLELLIRIWDAAWLSSINVMTMSAVVTLDPKTAFLQTGDKPADPQHDIII